MILGPTGRNFAAGMSGGIAYVLDTNKDFRGKCNMEMVELDTINSPHEIADLRSMIEDHHHWTGSKLAQRILANFNQFLPRFVRVMPTDFKAVIEKQAAKAAAEKLARYAPVPLAVPTGLDVVVAKAEPALVDLEDSMVDAATALKRSETIDKVRGFMKYKRVTESYRNPRKRVKDWAEISTRLSKDECKVQAARCMDCGVPFWCVLSPRTRIAFFLYDLTAYRFRRSQSDSGCPIGNIIPKWNDLVFKDQWQDALNRLLLTNNFPEFTGRVCPAPCEGACVLGINEQPGEFRSPRFLDALAGNSLVRHTTDSLCAQSESRASSVRLSITDSSKVGCDLDLLPAEPVNESLSLDLVSPPHRYSSTVLMRCAVGPAGLAAADQLNKAGHSVSVYERNDRIGGLLTYG